MIPGDRLTCDMCNHTWIQKALHAPRVCPQCCSSKWQSISRKKPSRCHGYSRDAYTKEAFYKLHPPEERSCRHCGHEWYSKVPYQHKEGGRYLRRQYCPKCHKGLDEDWKPRLKHGNHTTGAVPPMNHVHADHLTWVEKMQRGVV